MTGRADACFNDFEIIAAGQLAGIHPGYLAVQLKHLAQLFDKSIIVGRVRYKDVIRHGDALRMVIR